MTKQELAKFIDQTLLSPEATKKQAEDFCKTAKEYGFASVCINPVFVPLAAQILSGSQTKVCTVIDFPLGAGGLETKLSQADIAVTGGASELDFVCDLGLVKAQDWKTLAAQLSAITKSVREAAMFSEQEKSIVTKLILETTLLSDEEIINACICAKDSGFDFVKTSTGFSMKKPNGASVHAVELMRKTVGNTMGVKASGGIHTAEEALQFIQAGANRIGSSSGIQIVEGLKES
ncbi:deoxyribose-phosphate aldolase [Treponema sp.]|uniref:deoxyribose-phosphate aldolase n=1 Tax=Treponema sp. TaxID=166 RepID=UPI003F0AE4AD